MITKSTLTEVMIALYEANLAAHKAWQIVADATQEDENLMPPIYNLLYTTADDLAEATQKVVNIVRDMLDNGDES